MYGHGGLWVLHFLECESKYCCLFAVEEESNKFCSVTDATTNLKIGHIVKNTQFDLMGPVGPGFHPMKKCPHALLWVFASDR